MWTYDRDCFYLFSDFRCLSHRSIRSIEHFLFALILTTVRFIYVQSKSDTYPSDFFSCESILRWNFQSVHKHTHTHTLKREWRKKCVYRLAMLSLHWHPIDFRWQLCAQTPRHSPPIPCHCCPTWKTEHIERVHKSFNYVRPEIPCKQFANNRYQTRNTILYCGVEIYVYTVKRSCLHDGLNHQLLDSK